MKELHLPFWFMLTLSTASIFAEEEAIQPLMAVPDAIVFKSDFSESKNVKKIGWMPRQGTQWTIVDGVLRGNPSTAEYQEKKADHKGYEPRISVPATPSDFVVKFSIRFSDGKETRIAPFIEFGHHVCRIRFSEEGGAQLLADHESMLVAEDKNFKFESGKWIQATAEMKGDEFVIRFVDGPTLYAKHPSFAAPTKSGGKGFGVAGPRGGMVEIDNVSISSIKAGETQKKWKEQRNSFPKFEALEIKKKKPAKRPAK